MKRKKADMQGEIDRLNTALRAIVAACKREKPSIGDWPRTVGEVEAIASEALGYNVSYISGPYRFAGVGADERGMMR